jgi:transcriptional regulator NrdR family protein
VDSRSSKHSGIRRRRLCEGCGYRFTTAEAPVKDSTGLIESLTGTVTDQQLHRLRQGLEAVRLGDAYPLLEALARARYVMDSEPLT